MSFVNCLPFLGLLFPCPRNGRQFRGVARGLLQFAADQARKRKAWTLRLDVFDNNEPAIACYESFGFVDVGSFDIDVGDGLRHASHLMELNLRDERRGCPPHG
ncbi:MAG TPA: GNAT family N-acetyltransferase [Candidatus Olsenella pullistercoris]|uniref:GNAT family N-acetyltransferase n=1 Tax=Candidatus Olsenella pullistercoris TaxID=2838712 RepID=A0A9D2EXU2_9ACTN|nr:GNAT family N-acetyltransferase [Candidatus Olsenella pullistercoris]